MSKINLLPWRQERRQELKQEFFIIVGVVAFIAAMLVAFGYTVLATQVNDQDSRNSYIKLQISALDEKIAQIDDLQKRRDELVARMKVIEDLQGRRPGVVHIFDEFVRTLPDGVYYKSLQRDGDRFTIHGVAESKNEVSNLMRNLENSQWFKNPSLSSVVQQQPKDNGQNNGPSNGGGQGGDKKAVADAPASNEFTLTVMLAPQDVPGSKGDAAGTQNSGGGK